MKSCCDVDDNRKPNGYKKYLNWVIYILLFAIIVTILINEYSK